MDKALKNMQKRKDTTPTLDAQVVDLPEGDKNEKQIVIQRPDNDEDKNVNLPATSSGGALVPPNQPPMNMAALGQPNGELAPLGNRDVAEDVEFTVNSEEPEGIEGYKQAGESWHKSEETEDEEEPENKDLAVKEKNEIAENPEFVYDMDEEEDEDEELKKAGESWKGRKPKIRNKKDKGPLEDYNDKKTGDLETAGGEGTGLSDLLNSGASDFSINDIVESMPDIPHYQYKSLLNRR